MVVRRSARAGFKFGRIECVVSELAQFRQSRGFLPADPLCRLPRPRRVYFRGTLMSEILDLLHDSEERRFAAGEVILEEGGASGPLLFLAEGTVEVVIDGQQIATTSQPGTVFGVFSLLPAGRDAATIRALEPCVFRVVQNPRELLQASPQLCWHVCETVTQRLATLAAYLGDLQRQFAGTDHVGMMREVLAALLHRQRPARIRPSESTIRQGEVVD